MRELKFRAWIVESRVMAGMEDDPLAMMSLGDIYAFSTMGDPPVIIMQSTGLRDKNGKEIYEGDVLHFGEYSDGSGLCNHVVFWSEGDACFCTEEITLGIKFASVDNEVATVIGNIHEHRHLLQS